MGLVSQNGIAYIIIVGNLYFVKQDHVFQFCGISYHSTFPNQCIAADKRTVAHLGVLTDNGRAVDECSGGYLCGFGDPNILSPLLVLLLRQCAAQFYNKFADKREHFPGICPAFQKLFCHCLI